MGKIEVNENLTVTAKDIETELVKMDSRLRGLIDDSNISDNRINKEFVSEFATDNNPINSHKLIASTTTEQGNNESPLKILARTQLALDNNPEYILLTGSATSILNSDSNSFSDLIINIDKPENYEIEEWSNGIKKIWCSVRTDFDVGTATPPALSTFLTHAVSSSERNNNTVSVKITRDYIRSSKNLNSGDFINLYVTAYAKAKRIR